MRGLQEARLLHESFAARIRDTLESVQSGNRTPEEFLLAQKRLLLASYERRAKVAEDARKDAMRRFEDEIGSMEKTTEALRAEIDAARAREPKSSRRSGAATPRAGAAPTGRRRASKKRTGPARRPRGPQ